MAEGFDIAVNFDKGFIGSLITPDALSQAHLISPTENVWYSTLKQLEVFQGCIAGMTNCGGPLIMLAGTVWVTMVSGGCVMYRGKSLWFLGTGTVRTVDPSNPAAIVVIGTASSILQIVILKGSTYQPAVQAGLSAPSAPTLAANATLGPGFTGKNTGTFGAQITKFRSTTGAESNPSPPSNVVSATAQSLSITIPGPPIDGTDTWNVYVSPNGFGGTGPYLFLLSINEVDLTDTATGTVNIGVSTTTWTRVSGHTLTASDVGKQIIIVGAGPAGGTLTTTIATVNVGAQSLTFVTPASTSVVGAATTLNAFLNGVPRAVEIEWSDGELVLSVRAPIDHDPPPSGSFPFAIGNIMNVAGCYNGLGVACSIPGQPEAFNPDNVSFLPEPVVNVVGRPQDGFVYLICANSIHAAVYTGAVDGPPVMVRTLWDKVGCAGFTAAAVHGQTLYVFTGNSATGSNKLVRTDPSGNIDYEFSRRIDAEVRSWNPQNVVLGYDDRRKVLSAIHNQEIFSYHDALDVFGHLKLNLVTGAGNPTGNITSCYTQNGRLYLLASESGQYNQYLFDQAGSGVAAFKFTPAWQNGLVAIDGFQRAGRQHMIKTPKQWFLDYLSATNFTLAGQVLANLNVAEIRGSVNLPIVASKLMTGWITGVVVAGRLFTVTWSGSGAGQQFYAMQITGSVSTIRA